MIRDQIQEQDKISFPDLIAKSTQDSTKNYDYRPIEILSIEMYRVKIKAIYQRKREWMLANFEADKYIRK